MKKICLVIPMLVMVYTACYGQLCNGSLGDPVVHISFGNNGTPVAPLRNGVTNLSCTSASCPDDGQYTLAGSSAGCFGNTWFSLSSDHTGDAGGRFMLVNASFTPNDFYVDTVKGLCGNTTYEFAAWIVNMLKASACNGNGRRPNLTFRIETASGTVLKRFETGDILAGLQPNWQQFGTFFQTPVGAGAVVLRITNNAPGGCGNDLALDDITFRPCGPRITSYANGGSTALVDMCENKQPDLSFTTVFSAGFTDPVLQWQLSVDSGKTWVDIAGADNSAYIRKPTASGLFQYRVAIAERSNAGSAQCRIASNVTSITVHPLPAATSLASVKGCSGSNLRLQAVEGNGFRYQWAGPNGFTSTVAAPLLTPAGFTDSGLYQVSITTPAGCSRTDSLRVSIVPGATAIVNGGGNICEGAAASLTASGGVQYQWKPSTGLSDTGISNPLASPTDSTRYRVVVTNQYGCSDSAVTAVNVWKKPIVHAGADRQLFEGESVVLDGTVTGHASAYYWRPLTAIVNSNSLKPVVNPSDNTAYTLYAVSGFGCATISDEVVVKVYKKIVASNSFSPNGDGVNDTWTIRGLESYPASVISIFNRSGQLLFQSKAYQGGWDGTYNGRPLPVGTYYYMIDLKMGLLPVSGWVLILR